MSDAYMHLNTRYDMLSRQGKGGSITREAYIAANMRHTIRNIRNGLVPDGCGGYRVDSNP